MSRDDIDHREPRPAGPSSTPPYFRDPPEGPIELVVPRADGGRPDVYAIDDRVAHVHMVDLSLALLRRLSRPVEIQRREPA